jgi:hypothetical protein
VDLPLVVLRCFHIVSGALWFGSAFMFVGFVSPTVAEMGPSSGPFMSLLVKKHRLGSVFNALVVTTGIAGWLMWLVLVSRYTPAQWFGHPYGLVLTTGAVLGTIAGVLGIVGVGRNVSRIIELGDGIRASGTTPSPEQGAQLGRLGADLARYSRIVLVLLFVAVAAMAVAEYW